MSIFWNASNNSFEDNKRWSWLRAIEWKAWPAFVTQPIVPILFAFFPFYSVIIAMFFVNLIWMSVRWSLVNVSLASAGAIFVVYTKWPSCVAMCGYFIFKGAYLLAFISILWPLVGSIASFPCSMGSGIGVFELKFMEKLGYQFASE